MTFMKYKAIFLDLDGTTVKHALETLPAPRVTQAINAAKKKIHVCLATGRSYLEVEKIFNHLDLSGPCVVANGIQIYDPITKKVIKETPLDKSLLPVINKVFKKYKLQSYVFDGTLESMYENKANPPKILSIFSDTHLPKEIIDQVENELKQFSEIVVHKLISIRVPGTFMLEICDKNATKLHGIIEIAKILKIQTHEMIGVGDAYNDFPLLMACGLKIAMGNAVPELKAIADFIAPSVDEDGVATVIEKFVLGK
ncbi:MAG: Cof-like protein hydrolase [Candidatus Gottesmanbacteria bacterium GW2011_GWA1_34_13]|uniref:Cof-like protein hydrolase n=1 Tax=Candidatus Gottesmanbacteria bacterium GW2011_GWA1_34_13 TaxID=1618434 RepID=A0A0G0ASI7_9BACT|nr:MAG: Cof-like protein hydrolase [Candidatus Gottesmanbacteria bacterium GW2011_GWA1_34_13]